MRRLQTGNVLVIKSLLYTIPDGPTSYLGTLDIRGICDHGIPRQ